MDLFVWTKKAVELVVRYTIDSIFLGHPILPIYDVSTHDSI